MSERRVWITAAVVLAVFAAAGAAAVTLVETGRQPVAFQDLEDAGEAGVVHAVALPQQEEAVEPAAICRLIPECSKNSDCDAKCGFGLGKCAHSTCPVRVCRCR